MTKPPNELNAIDALAAIAAGRFTAEALMRSCLERIAERDALVKAFVAFDSERALAEARACDRVGSRGPLFGLPLGVKDIIDTHDMPTQCGSPIYSGHRPPNDAACVALAREAGAVMLGKTVTTEFALRNPGPTTNPRNPLHTPGGSSSGSAAAVADMMVPVAFGTQTGGSIIRPASYCGVVGYKPSLNTINPAGVKPLATSFDTVGLLARSVDDCALVAGVLSGAVRDATSGWHPLEPVRPARIGLCRTHSWSGAEPATVDAVESAAEQFRREGITVDDVELPGDFAAFNDRQNDVLRYEAARIYAFERTRHPNLVSQSMRDELAAGLALTHAQYRDAQALIARCRALFAAAIAPFDAFLSPSAPGEAPLGLTNTGDAMFNRLQSGLGLPCVTLPGYLGPVGLPVGVQLTGASGEDARLLRTAKWIARLIEGSTAK